MGQRPRRQRVRHLFTALTASVVVAVGAAALLPTIASAAARPLTFNLSIGDECLYGRAANNAKVSLVWRDQDGVSKGKKTIKAEPDGYWQECFSYDGRVAPGDTVKGTVKTTSRTLTVPKLTIAANRVADTVHGKGPAGDTVTAYVDDYASNTYSSADEVVATDGTYSHDFSGDIDILGCVYVSLSWQDSANDQVNRQTSSSCLGFRVGRLSSSYGDDQVWGRVRSLAAVEIDLADSGDTPKAVAYGVGSYPNGYFSTEFGDDDGEPVVVLPGDKISAPTIASDAHFTVPNITASTNLTTDVVSGTCIPNGYYELNVYGPQQGIRAAAQRRALLRARPADTDGGRSSYKSGYANGSGHFSKDLTSDMNLRAGDIVNLGCRLVTGDWVQRTVIAS